VERGRGETNGGEEGGGEGAKAGENERKEGKRGGKITGEDEDGGMGDGDVRMERGGDARV